MAKPLILAFCLFAAYALIGAPLMNAGQTALAQNNARLAQVADL